MSKSESLLAQKSLFDRYLSLQTHNLSTFHFSSIFLWQNFFDFEFEVKDDSLCVYASNKGSSFLYLPPLASSLKPSVLTYCFEKMRRINPNTARIENVEQVQLNEMGDQFKGYAKLEEYVYDKSNLVELKGHAYKSQRHDIHHFETHQKATFRRYEPSDLKDCLELYARWAQNRHDKHEDPIYRSMLEENKIVHELALLHHEVLGLWGYVVEIDQKIAAYSLGYSLNSQTFCVLLEISETKFVGLPAFIFNRVCSDPALDPYTFINTMDDFGLPYVAASKQAYHPKARPVSYTLTLKNLS